MRIDPGLGRLTSIISSDADGALAASPLDCSFLPVFWLLSWFILQITFSPCTLIFRGPCLTRCWQVGEGRKAPFSQALAVILGDHESEMKSDRRIKNILDGASSWIDDNLPAIPRAFADAKIDELSEELLNFAQRLDDLGVYMLRVMQFAHGENLPEEVFISFPEPPAPAEEEPAETEAPALPRRPRTSPGRVRKYPL
jgi:hypothetical protein